MHESLSNTIDYIEMPSRTLAETKRFFSALFGWSFIDYGSDFSSFDDGQMVGGFLLRKILTQLKKRGGKITREIFEFRGSRRFYFREPGGGEFAMWSDK